MPVVDTPRPGVVATSAGASGRAARTAAVSEPCATGRNLARLLKRRRKCLWGNGFKIQGRNTTTARQTAANRHREWLHRPEQADLRAAVRRELRGLRLGCWCEQPGPCHGHNLCAVADADFDAGGDSSTL